MTPARLLISKIDKLFLQDSNETVFDITVSFFEDDTLIEDRRYSYPLSTSLDDLKLELAKALSAYNQERDQVEQNTEADAVSEAADETIEQLTGMEINEG